MTLSVVSYLNIAKEYGKYVAAGFFYVLVFKILLIADRWLIDFFWYGLFLSLFFVLDQLASKIIENIFFRRIALYFLAGFSGVFFIGWLAEAGDGSFMLDVVNFAYAAGLVSFSFAIYHKNRSKEFNLDSYVWLLALGSMFVAVDGLFYFILHNQMFWKLIATLMIFSWHIVYWYDFFVLRREHLEKPVVHEKVDNELSDDMVIEIKEEDMAEEGFNDDENEEEDK